MSYREAVEDGIRHHNQFASSYYYPLCHECGSEVPSWSYQRGVKYRCKECRALELVADKKRRSSNNYDAKEIKFQNAIKRIKKVAWRFGDYEKAIDTIHKKLHKDGWFDSTEEIMAAIELVQRGIKARHQVKMGRYYADFVLPDDKIILEIDGILYHSGNVKKQKDAMRDDLMLLAMGAGWDVIRITDEFINQNVTKLMPAIYAVKKTRNKLRDLNNGVLPEYYNGRSY